MLLFGVYLFAGQLLAADTVPQGKIGIIGDSIAAGTHSSEMCRNQDIVDCVQDLAGQHSPDWSYAGGGQSWSVASVLGYLPDRVVDASDGGEEWKDAFDQAVQIMADPEVETVFIGLGANDVCQARGHNYSGDLEVVASLIDETLNYLTSNLPDGGSIYWSGVPDVVQMRELMRNRDHNIVFETCQATWDLDGNDVKEGEAADACDHYFSNNFCESAGAQGQAVDLLVELLLDSWKDIKGVNEGPCGKVLNSGSTDQDRLEARNFTVALNRLMAQKARDWTGRNGIDVHYNDRLFYATPTVQPHHISRFDCFHPSRSGQMKFAYEIWSGFNHGNEQLKGVFIDEFDSIDYCTQEFGDWGSCWVETNDDNAATSGDIQIAGNVVSMRSGSKQISRAMDLQHVDQAWLSFNRRRDNLDHLGDFVEIQASPDAGQTWHLLEHFVGEATDFGFHRGSYYDISQYATADTLIRLISSSQMGENDWLFFDNVKVNSWDSSAVSQAAPVYGELLLDENWQAVDTPTTDSPPVAFMGVATDSAGGAGVAAVRNVGTDHFEVQLQELAEAGGDVSAERVPYLVLQTGTYVMPDGSHWEVGTFDIAADGTWQSQVFKTPFADRPFLFLSLQTANNAVFPVLQVRSVDTAGFEAALFEQVTSSSMGLNETAAYLAIYSPANAGTVRIADTYQSYRLQREPLDGYWTPVLDTFLRLRDGMLEDDSINAETHDVMALGTHVFAQQVSKTGSDLAVSQQIVDGVRDDVVMDFGGAGLWARMNDASWLKLNNSSPEQVVVGDMDGNGQDDVIAVFGSGIFVKRNLGGWSQLHNFVPELMAVGDLDNNGQDDVVIDFGGIGLWARMNDASWLKLNNASPDQVVAGDMDGNGADDVIAVFSSGIFVKRNLGAWTQLHNSIPEQMAVGDLDNDGKDDVVIDFGAIALWARMNDSAWLKLHNSSPELITTGDLDGNGADDVLATFLDLGLWQKLNLGGWNSLNNNAPDDMVTGDVNGSSQG